MCAGTRKINPEYAEALKKIIENAPFHRLCGLRVTDISPGHSMIEADVTRELTNTWHGVHGGLYATMIDTATACAVCCGLDEDAGVVTTDLDVRDIAMAGEGALLRAEGRALKVGRRMAFAEARIEDGDGRLIAFGTATLMVMKMNERDHGGAEHFSSALPPKFIK